MPVLPGITPDADFYLEADVESGRVRVRGADSHLLALIDLSSAAGSLILAATISGLRVLVPSAKVYDLSLRRYITDLPNAVEAKDADATKPADPA
jgi:hypothetical protein